MLNKYGICHLLLIMTMLLLAAPLQAQLNINLLGQLSYPNDLNDIWGYADGNGNEYALVGTFNGLSIVDVSTDPGNPTQLHFVNDTTSSWHDVKTYGDYAYVINEYTGGLLIVDLSNLPASVSTYTTDLGIGFAEGHNLFIDENGILYIFGGNTGVGGAIMANLYPDPTNPVYLGIYTGNYIHDGYVRNDTLWACEIYQGRLTAIDVSNKTAPTVIASTTTPKNFAHACWLSDDGATVYLTDEKPGAWVVAYDVTDVYDINERDRYQNLPGSNIIPHNPLVKGDFIITSYYTSGVTIADATHPYNIIEVGNYDSTPISGQGFYGCWGAYPFLPSGKLLISDMEEGLFVLAPTYVQACYLEGIVTDNLSTNPIFEAQVSIVATMRTSDLTDFSGGYATGTAQTGLYQVITAADGYYNDTAYIAFPTSGAIIYHNVALQPILPCDNPPDGIAASDITYNSAKITWHHLIDAFGYTLQYRATDNTAWTQLSLPDASYVINDLQALTEYEVQIKASCSGAESPFSASYIFTSAAPPCHIPEGLEIWAYDQTSAWLRWQQSEFALDYTLAYKPDGSAIWSTQIVSDTTTQLSGLYPCVTYDFKVRANCLGGSSDYGNVVSQALPAPNAEWSIPPPLYECDAPLDLNSLVTGEAGGTWSGGSYVSASGIFDPSGLTAGSYTVFYTISNGNCQSTHSNFITINDCIFRVQLKVYLEGAYLGNGSMSSELSGLAAFPLQQPYNAAPWHYNGSDSIVSVFNGLTDWILVELRDSSNSNVLLGSSAALLLNDGMVVDESDQLPGVIFSGLHPNRSYFVVVRHRNHLAVLSELAINLPNAVPYDFTANVNRASGATLSQLPDGAYALFAGDIDANGIISVVDYNLLKTQLSFINQYVSGDLQLNKSVTVDDLNFYRLNASKIGVASIMY